MCDKVVRNGLIVAGLSNIIGVLLFSRFFTNHAIPEADPVVMSNFGLLMIVIWGLVFLASSCSFQRVKWVFGAFAVEKLAYVVAWANWNLTNSVSVVFDKDALAGIFYAIYGLNDFVFLIFFVGVFYKLGKPNS